MFRPTWVVTTGFAAQRSAITDLHAPARLAGGSVKAAG
jgi:hypothetical protein